MRVSELIRALASMDPVAEIVIVDFESGSEIHPDAVTTRAELEHEECTAEEYDAACKNPKIAGARHPSDVLIGAGSRE